MRHSSIYSGNLEAGIARKSEGKTDIPATIQFRRFAVIAHKIVFPASTQN
jgi:hypothetical protein